MNFSQDLSVFVDVAGQITASQPAHNGWMTLAGVVIDTSKSDLVRDLIPRDFPKWRDCKGEHASFIIQILVQHARALVANSVDLNTEAWKAFCGDAKLFGKALARSDGRPVGVFKAPNLLRCVALAEAAAISSAHAVRMDTTPREPGLMVVRQTLTFDDEIAGDSLDSFSTFGADITTTNPLRPTWASSLRQRPSI